VRTRSSSGPFILRSRARARGFFVPRPGRQARQQDSSRSRFSRRQGLGSHLIFLSTASFFAYFLVSHCRQDFSLPAFAVWHSCAVRFCRKKSFLSPFCATRAGAAPSGLVSREQFSIPAGRRPALHFPPFAVGFAPQIPVTGPTLGLRSASCLHGFLGAGQIIGHAYRDFFPGRFLLFCILVSLDLNAQLIFFSRIFLLLHRIVLHRFPCRLFPVGEEICLPCLGF
jgi:hypothetical protein